MVGVFDKVLLVKICCTWDRFIGFICIDVGWSIVMLDGHHVHHFFKWLELRFNHVIIPLKIQLFQPDFKHSPVYYGRHGIHCHLTTVLVLLKGLILRLSQGFALQTWEVHVVGPHRLILRSGASGSHRSSGTRCLKVLNKLSLLLIKNDRFLHYKACPFFRGRATNLFHCFVASRSSQVLPRVPPLRWRHITIGNFHLIIIN